MTAAAIALPLANRSLATRPLTSLPLTSEDAVAGATGGVFGAVSRWVIDVMGLIGAPGAGLAVFLENVFPPVPSEVVLPLAGLAAAQGRFGVVDAVLWTTAGSVLGAYLLYAIGRALGHDRITRLARRIPLLDVEDVDRAVSWFDRHEDAAVLLGRLVPGVRSLISVPAGVERMPPLRFGVLTLAGSGLWNTVFILAGYLLGDHWDAVLIWVDAAKYAIVAGAAVLLVGYLVARVRRRRSRA
ncbi:DedA family protein [Tersicoccus sp. MR15.9]|uniref:DedA family protein n=1 Tax=Tersicoccus mangrovi TaxID=3121635 RepID=UPI002FE549DC